jgi:GT2 family glycosyltransferase
LSISILNYQRKDTLRSALAAVLSRTTSDTEVLVVDNASTDGSADMVSAEFPNVRVIALRHNLGCAARNVGVAEAKADIVMTLDNDVLLNTANVADTLITLFDSRPSVACIDFKILDRDGMLSARDWCHPRDWRFCAHEEFFTFCVLEGASAFRKRTFEEVGGYWSPLFLGHEGLDLGLRLHAAGYGILYSPNVEVTHLASRTARPASRIYYTFTRNSIWVAIRNHRTAPGLRALLIDLVLMAFTSARAGHLRTYMRGLRDGILGAPEALRTRQPMTRSRYKDLKTLRLKEPTLLQKAVRHWRERTI